MASFMPSAWRMRRAIYSPKTKRDWSFIRTNSLLEVHSELVHRIGRQLGRFLRAALPLAALFPSYRRSGETMFHP